MNTNVDHLRAPPPIPYSDLSRALGHCEESLEYVAKKCDRQSTFIAALADYIYNAEPFNEETKRFLLQAMADQQKYELDIARARIEKLRAGTLIK